MSVASSVANSEIGMKKVRLVFLLCTHRNYCNVSLSIQSARQRRRESKQKENIETPAIFEEIRKSRSTGFKQGNRGKTKSKKIESKHASGDKTSDASVKDKVKDSVETCWNVALDI